jgi:hypothetical protein
MENPLREAWTTIIRPDDYETHMAAVGQAQANAKLVESYFLSAPLKPGDSVLFLGAGTGQMFNFVSPTFLLPFHTTFTDINGTYLKWLTERLKKVDGLKFKTLVDDVENSYLTEKFPLIVVVLVLEHVDWRKAVATIAALASSSVLVVIQENPATLPSAYSPGHHAAGTMSIFSKIHPTLVSQAELQAEFESHGLRKNYYEEKIVDAEKKMIALAFVRDSRQSSANQP